MKKKFDPEALRTMILAKNGDVSSIAKTLKTDSEELRAFIRSTPLLINAMDEVIHRGVDRSVAVLFDGLDDEHYGNRLAASKEFLKSRAAQRRGFHHAGDLELKLPGKSGALTLTWLPPEDTKPVGPLIEGTVEDD